MLQKLILLRYIICLLNLDLFSFYTFFTVLSTHTQRRGIKRKSKGLGVVKDGFLFFSFLGRLLFASIFILSAWQIFSKLDCLPRLSNQWRLLVFNVNHRPSPFQNIVLSCLLLVWLAICWFNEFGDDGGPAAKEWAPKLHFVKKFVDNRIGKSYLHVDSKTFVAACIFLKGLGGLLFVLGSGFGAFLLISCLVLTATMLYDFYNYDFGEPEFIRLLHEFLQCAAFVGALLFFLGMKNSVLRKKQPQKGP